jgi:hypothetical protein
MDEDKDKKYVMRPVVKEEPKASSEEQGAPESSQQPKTQKRMQLSQIPTDKIFKTLTNRDMMMETLHDETMEPHIHLTVLILIVIIMAIFISLLGL